MKEKGVNRRVQTEAGSRSKASLLFLLFLSFYSFTTPSKAQCLQNTKVFHAGEHVAYDLYFKWGMLMTKGAEASMNVSSSVYADQSVWKSELLLYSKGMIDKVFSIRDTLVNYTTQEKPRLLFSTKRSDEGGYYQIDNLSYSYIGDETHVHAFRRNKNRIKADTVLVGGDCVLDILGGLMFARSFDWHAMEQGKPAHLQVAMGKTVIPISYRYEGQRIVEHERAKYATRYFVIDIFDEAFTQSKEALEIWIGDDDNHLPIKVRAKLKLGAMEAYYKESSGLRFPLNSRIEMPKGK